MKRLSIATIFARANELAGFVVVGGCRPQHLHGGTAQGCRQRLGTQVGAHRADLRRDHVRHGREHRGAVDHRAEVGEARDRAAQLRVLPNMSSTIPRRSPLYDTIT
jgi:hypothetical protein